MALAVQREKRQNAGNKMAKLLDAEEEDDFYKTTYGGFTEVEFLLFSLCLSFLQRFSFRVNLLG